MMSETEVQQLIDHWVPHCCDFLESNREATKRRIVTLDKQRLRSKVGSNCPICSIKMVEPKKGVPKKGGSPSPNAWTTEHIVPLCLGGDNRSENLIAICHSCNDTRNVMMGKLLPELAPTSKTPIRGQKLDPSVQKIVEEFIEWGIRTIYTPSSELNSRLCQLFDERKRKEGQEVVYASDVRTVPIPTTSTLESTEILDVLNQILETQKAILEQLQKSPFKRFKDWLFSLFPSRKRVRKTKSPIEAEIAEAKTSIEDKQQEYITTPVKSGILGFSTIKYNLMPRDFNHTLEFLGTIHRLNLESISYKQALLLIRSEIGLTHPTNSDRNLIKTLHQLRGHEADDIVDTWYLNSKIEDIVDELHQYFMEKLIPHYEHEIDIPKVNEYFQSMGPNLTTSDTEDQFTSSDMRREILAILTEPMPMPQFNIALMKSLQDRGYPGYTAKSFVHACGVPKSWSMHKVLSTYLPASVGIEGDATTGIVRPLSSRLNQELEVITEMDTTTLDSTLSYDEGKKPIILSTEIKAGIPNQTPKTSDEKFPQVGGFNTSKGLQFPREPSDTAITIIHLHNAVNLGLINGVELKQHIAGETGIPTTRIRSVVKYSLNDYYSAHELGVIATIPLKPSIAQLFTCFKKTFERKTTQNEIQRSPRDDSVINSYFSDIEHLLENFVE